MFSYKMFHYRMYVKTRIAKKNISKFLYQQKRMFHVNSSHPSSPKKMHMFRNLRKNFPFKSILHTMCLFWWSEKMNEDLKQIYQLIDDILEDLKYVKHASVMRAKEKLKILKEKIEHKRFFESQKELVLKEKE